MYVSKELNEILKEWDSDWSNKIELSEDFNYLDIGLIKKEFISYIRKDKLDLFNNDFFNEELRKKYAVEEKPSKFFNKILKNNIKTDESEALLKYFNVEKDYEFKIIEGDEIKKYYLEDSYDKNVKMLNDSCMRHEKCQPYLDIYKDNAKLLVFINKKTDKISGRALIWNAELNNESILFMDRIYAENIIKYKFIDYAKSKNMYMRGESRHFYIDLDGKKHLTFEVSLKINIDITKYTTTPYMDTFYIAKKDGIYANDAIRIIDSMRGNYKICKICGEHINYYAGDDDDWLDEYDDYVCLSCIDNNKVLINDIWYKKNSDKIFWCNKCKKYHHITNKKRYHMCVDCYNLLYIKVNNRVYKKNSKKIYFDELDKVWRLKSEKESD